MTKTDFAIVGGGIAGCECALVLARYGLSSTLFEQKPLYRSPAHVSDAFSELVCSNSLRSNERTSGIGLLKNEMRALHSPFMSTADQCRLPAGKALAVDRKNFSQSISRQIMANPLIQTQSLRIDSLNDGILADTGKHGIIIAAGPLASDDLVSSLSDLTGSHHCYFYDAIAPIIWTDTLNHNIVFRASRYNTNEIGDYLNCPMNKDEYEVFHAALCTGEIFGTQHAESEVHFEGCMPIEALAKRGQRTLAFGPMKPVGLVDPRTGKRPWAVLQLRAESVNMETCNLVGCQTKLLQNEQMRIFRLVPGLENVEFARFGSMHRNTYVNAPEVLAEDLSLKSNPHIFLAGQITGVEGYVESAACGLWLGLMLAARSKGVILESPPAETALGALMAHLKQKRKNFQPSNIHFGLMPELGSIIKKKDRKEVYAIRAEKAFTSWQETFHNFL